MMDEDVMRAYYATPINSINTTILEISRKKMPFITSHKHQRGRCPQDIKNAQTPNDEPGMLQHGFPECDATIREANHRERRIASLTIENSRKRRLGIQKANNH